MQLTPSLILAGNAEAALAHYRDALGGDLEIVRFAGSPAESSAPSDWLEKVLFGSLRTRFGNIYAMDAPPGRAGVPGDNFAIEIQVESEAQGADIFSKLADGGTVQMPYEETFWAQRFGMVTDRYGYKWMLNYGRRQNAA